MKGILLHGGFGSRLRPLTHTGPKQLIPIAGKPISQYCLEDLRDAGVKDVAIVLGSVWPEKVREYYRDGSWLGMRLHYIEQGEPKGLAQAVGLGKEFVGNDKFVVYLGDNLLRGGVAEHAATFASGNSDAMILLSRVTEPERFGVAKFNDAGELEGLIEKPKKPPSAFALVGVYFFTPRIFQAISKLKPSPRGELEITEAIQHLLTSGNNVQHSFVEGWWKDTGTPDDILEANRLVLDEKLTKSEVKGSIEDGAIIQGRVRVESGVIVRKGVTVRGPVHIGANSTVEEDAYIGPYTSVGELCRLQSCEIENTVIMNGCTITTRGRITDSIIGPESEITDWTNTGPKGHRFILGEKSRLHL